MKSNRVAILSLLLTSAMGCQSSGYYAIEEAYTSSASLDDVLARDISLTVERNFPPAKTRILLPHRKQKVAMKLEERFRSAGYAVSTDPKARNSEDLQIGYKIDSPESGIFLLTVVAGPHFQVSRVYQKLKDGSIASAGPMLLRKDGGAS